MNQLQALFVIGFETTPLKTIISMPNASACKKDEIKNIDKIILYSISTEVTTLTDLHKEKIITIFVMSN